MIPPSSNGWSAIPGKSARLRRVVDCSVVLPPVPGALRVVHVVVRRRVQRQAVHAAVPRVVHPVVLPRAVRVRLHRLAPRRRWPVCHPSPVHRARLPR